MQTNKKFTTTTVCKNIIENFVVRVVLLKESIIILRGKSVILYNKIAKIDYYVYIN